MQSPCGLMADLPGNFENALVDTSAIEVYLRYLPYLFFEGYLCSSHNCHPYFVPILNQSPPRATPPTGQSITLAMRPYILNSWKRNMTVPRKVKVHTNEYLGTGRCQYPFFPARLSTLDGGRYRYTS